MSRLGLTRISAWKAAGERGAVLVMVAVWMTSAIFLVTFVIDVGHWFVHQRHLQLQADSAALAGGGKFGACFNNGGGDSAMFNEATKYAGAVGTFNGTAYGTSRYNPQIGESHIGTVSVRYQSATYADGSNPHDGTETAGPCETAHFMFDVKATEQNLPLFFIGGSFVPAINTHARVQLQALGDTNPSLPLAVPDVNPRQVGVTFVDESNGAELTGCTGANKITGTGCSFSLTKEATPVNGLNMWSGPASVTLPSAPAKIGVRVGIGGTVLSCANTLPQNSNGTNYSCYDGASQTAGLTMIRDYAVSAPATPPAGSNLSAPVLEGVWPSSCSGNGAFYYVASGTCGSGVTAEINYGTGATQPGANYFIRATVNGTTADLRPSSYDSARNSWIWTTSAATPPFALAAEAQAQGISLAWEVQDTSKTFNGSQCRTQGNNPCKGNFANAPQQRFYGGLDDPAGSGPIRSVAITGSSDPLGPASLVSDTYSLSVRIGLAGNYQVHTPCTPPPSGASYNCSTDPAVLLRLKTRNGNTTFSVDCGTLPGHTGGDLYQQITYGCANRFSLNAPDVCPDPANPSPPDCAPVNNVGSGLARGQVVQAMNDRFAPNNSCLPNNYPTIAPGDKRVVILILTDFSAFNGNGAGVQVPVVRYGAFYVTGWDSADNSCNSQNEPFPGPGTTNTGMIWGHFITYVDPNGHPNGGPCDPSGLLPCVPALTQ